MVRITIEYGYLSNDLEFPPILLVSDWPRRHLLECTSVSTPQRAFRGVFGVSIFSHARFIAVGAIKKQ